MCSSFRKMVFFKKNSCTYIWSVVNFQLKNNWQCVERNIPILYYVRYKLLFWWEHSNISFSRFSLHINHIYQVYLSNPLHKPNRKTMSHIFVGTKSLFSNLIAFEQCHANSSNDITSYVIFMDNLINSAEDVSYLSCTIVVSSSIG